MGDAEGLFVGNAEGTRDPVTVGLLEGVRVRVKAVGDAEGLFVGNAEGTRDPVTVGLLEGAAIGWDEAEDNINTCTIGTPR